ncbi:3'(2'),5'-bisphosphate nucleotidase CysQ [Mesorhizobium xinjiangense]|uniref:3'(2'),5'-bisphosphate nucleotidase CysQ n=1 Tax=Mesorhizobium xinjiangense TaxID=2678685 RepID=UPI001F4669BB|nr:3'(2'),5'-bisphosphate nucleotidase CysQ [Mesorhizobium xinjiangense]
MTAQQGAGVDHGAMLAEFERLALAAGREILAVRQAGFTADTKADSSPVTEADRRAETIILDGLRARYPQIACVAEEEMSEGRVPAEIGDAFFLVDPLDGTKEFVGGKSDFTVNIAYVVDGTPVVGAVYAPARGALYAGRPGHAEQVAVSAAGDPGGRHAMSVSPCNDPVRVVASRSHRTPETDSFIAECGEAEIVSVGSSLKFCLLAAGEADLYPRFGRTMEWDTAAGDAVLRAAGGRTLLLDGAPFRYGKRNQADDVDFANPYFIALGGLKDLPARR